MNKSIVIVGGGPVGLTVAEMLTQQGIPVTVLEKDDSPSREWRASTFHAGTLELLDSVGVAEELMSRGLIADKVQYRDRKEGLYAEFDFSQLKDETKYPFRLQCPQSTYVQILYKHLQKRSNAKILFNTEFVGQVQDQEGVTVTIQTPEGKQELRASLVIGADGARSAVRKSLGFAFEGFTYEERFLLVGTPIAFDQFLPDIAYVNYVSDPDEFLFILRVPEAWRLLYPIPLDVSDEEALSDGKIQRTLQGALKTDTVFPIVERMIYRVHQRVAEKFYNGRVIILGDAAHVNSPLGGLGLNSGIHDAVDLSRRLIRVLAGGDGTNLEAELAAFNQVRRKVAMDFVQSMTKRNTNVMKEKDSKYRLELQKEMAQEADDPERARKWMLRSSLITSVREHGVGEPPKA